MKSPRKHHGAQVPVLSIHFMNEFKGRSLARDQRRAKNIQHRTPNIQKLGAETILAVGCWPDQAWPSFWATSAGVRP